MTQLSGYASNTYFPDPEHIPSTNNGLVTVGKDLSVNTLLKAYSLGIFPWFSLGDPILWWSPDPRGVLWSHQVHISHSLGKLLNKNHYRVTTDQNFSQVVAGCAAPRKTSNNTWIVPAMHDAYRRLHDSGFAHSIEVYNPEQQLVGGLYGVQLGSMFFGESMFSKEPNTSKIALVLLSRWLQRYGCPLIDTQLPNPHLLTLGVSVCPRRTFLQQLHHLIQIPASPPWGTELHELGLHHSPSTLSRAMLN